MEIANTIDEKLFADYTKRRLKEIKEKIKRGILEGIDWSTLKEPFGLPFSTVCLIPQRFNRTFIKHFSRLSLPTRRCHPRLPKF